MSVSWVILFYTCSSLLIVIDMVLEDVTELWVWPFLISLKEELVWLIRCRLKVITQARKRSYRRYCWMETIYAWQVFSMKIWRHCWLLLIAYSGRRRAGYCCSWRLLNSIHVLQVRGAFWSCLSELWGSLHSSGFGSSNWFGHNQAKTFSANGTYSQ